MIKNNYVRFLVIGVIALLILARILRMVSDDGAVAVIDEMESNKTNTSTTTKVVDTNNTKKTMTQITELGIIDEAVGTGDTAVAGKSVTVHYVGSLMNGTIFDASKNHGTQGFTFNLGAGEVIKGWDVGVAGMKVGGKRKLTIPAAMAYGNQDVGGGLIPANSDLIFEVELLKVGK